MNFFKKNLAVLFIMAIALTNYSCSSDDDSSTDKIESVLSTSKVAYQNANSGDWIGITKLEFEALINNLDNVSKVGIDENLYPTSASGLSANFLPGNGLTHANETSANIPKDSYVFAIRFYVGPVGIHSNTLKNKIKQSDTSATEGYIDLGNPLPQLAPVGREVFFLLKRSSIKTKNLGYLGIYTSDQNALGIIRNTSEDSYFSPGDEINLTNVSRQTQKTYQGLSTTEKQWD